MILVKYKHKHTYTTIYLSKCYSTTIRTVIIFQTAEKYNYFLFSALSVEGEMLSLTKITRSEMGAYLCIAANGVPPTVSKRMMLHVHCK